MNSFLLLIFRHFVHRLFPLLNVLNVELLRLSVISTDIICQTIVQHCRAADLELTATCCVKVRLSVLSNQDLKLICFILLSANYSTYLFRKRLCSRLTALWHFINFVLLLLVGGVAQWLGCRSVAGGLSLICA